MNNILHQSLKITALLLFISASLNAQKVDLDKYWYNAESKVLPSKPLPEGKHTYHVDSRGSTIANESVANTSVMDMIAIAGFKKVTGKAHVNVAVEFGDLIITSSRTDTRTETQKDKNDKVVSTTYYYKKTVIYSMNMKGKATNEFGTEMVNLNSNRANLTWSSREFSRSGDADDYYRNSYNDIRRELASDVINNYIRETNLTLNSLYGYPDVKTRDYIWFEAAKKHPEFASQQENWESVKAFIPTISGNAAITQAQMDQIKPVLDYLQGVKTKYTTDEKNDKKMRYQAYFALATLYILLDNLDAAEKEANGLITNDYDAKDGKRFLDEIEKIRKSFEVNKVTSRHYNVDPEVNTPPSK